MTSGVILDIDGTLVDTNYHHAIAWYEAFRQHGITLPTWRIHHTIGMGGDQFVEHLTDEDVERRLGDAIRASHDTLYMERIETTSVLDGARGLIEDLRTAGRRVVLASSAGAQEVEHYLDLLDARDLVEGWTTSDDVERTKPHPDLVHAALAKLGTDTATMVGDTPWDVRAARQAGVKTVAVLSGGFARAELEAAGAVLVFDSVAQLRSELSRTPLFD